MVDHGVVIRALPTTSLAESLRLGVSSEMHVGEVHPYEGRLTRLVLSLDEVHSSVGDIIVDRHHPRLGQRACVLAHLLADSAEAWIDCWVVYIRGFAVHHAARSILRTELWVFGICR